MVQQRSDMPLPFTSFTMQLCYEEILINQVPKAAVGCDELPEQDNPGGVARLWLERFRHSVSWVEECFYEIVATNGCEAFILVKIKSLAYLESVCKMNEGNFRCI